MRQKMGELGALEVRAELLGSARQEDDLEVTLSELRRMGAGNAGRIAAAWAIAGVAYLNMERPETAVDAYMRAHRLAPREDAYLWALARLARAQGRRAEAARFLRTLCRQGQDRACEP